MKPEQKYLFVVDTDAYSGNFERELTAYCTGCVGDCGVGDDEAEDFQLLHSDIGEEVAVIIHQETDEHGCYRPATIWPTPGWSNNGLGKHTRVSSSDKIKCPAYMSVGMWFTEAPSSQMVAVIKERAAKFFREYYTRGKVTIAGFRLIKKLTTYTEEIV